jgi:hypothetical protein
MKKKPDLKERMKDKYYESFANRAGQRSFDALVVLGTVLILYFFVKEKEGK